MFHDSITINQKSKIPPPSYDLYSTNHSNHSLNKVPTYGSIEHFQSLRYDLSFSQALPKQVKDYYQRQNSIIDKFVDALDSTEQSIDQTILKFRKRVKFLTILSLVFNICLFLFKIIAAILSNSLSVVSSVIDSAVDLISSIILFWTARVIENRNQYRYPAGRARLEPVAIIILSVIMCSASVQVFSEATKRLLVYIEYMINSKKEMPEVNMNIHQPFPIIVMCLTIVVKIILYRCCRDVPIDTMKALAHDHRNDVLSNSVALISGFIAGQAFPRHINIAFIVIDPIGAILLSVYIIISWVNQATLHIRRLIGITADPDILKLITWIAIHFTPSVAKINMIRAFHIGTDLLVEVHIALPSKMQIEETHDISTNLQAKLESLPEIERAFVHIDCEFEHQTDRHKQI